MLMELSKVEQRYEAVLAVIRDGLAVTEVAAAFGVGRQTVHVWLARYEAGGLGALEDRSHLESSVMEHLRGRRSDTILERCMAHSPKSPPPETPHHQHNVAFDALLALSMAIGRGSAAKQVASLAELTRDDRVVDIGCGPGAAVRMAARRCAHTTGVDPSPASLALGRRLNAIGGKRNIELVHGSAEAIPLPDCSATVLWALRSVHHWGDRAHADWPRLFGCSGRADDCCSPSVSSSRGRMEE